MLLHKATAEILWLVHRHQWCFCLWHMLQMLLTLPLHWSAGSVFHTSGLLFIPLHWLKTCSKGGGLVLKQTV